MADMPEGRHSALRESVWAAGVAYSDLRIDIPTTLNLNALMKVEQMKSNSFKVGRSAKTGRFTTLKKATQRKSTHVIEAIKKK